MSDRGIYHAMHRTLDWLRLRRLIGINPATPAADQEGQVRYARSGDVDGKAYLARYLAGGTYEWYDVTSGVGASTVEAAQDAVGTILVDSTSIDFTYADATPSITAAAIFGTTAGTVAEGNHTHVGGGSTIVVNEGGVLVTTADTLNVDDTDFNTSVSPAGTVNLSLNYGTGANQPAEGNHTHSYQPLDADLTVIAGLVDPNADRILFWDDSAGAYAYLAPGTNLSITGTTIDATGGGGTVNTATLAFGTTAVPDKTFTVTDAAISATSKIIPAISWISGFTRDMDEIMSDPILITCKPAAGSMTVYAQAYLGTVSGDYPLVYSIA